MTADPKPVRAAAEADAEARLEFRVAVLATDQGCVVHGDPEGCEGDVHAHHVVTQQQLRKAGRLDLSWDPDNGAAVCTGAHRRHHNGLERIPFDRLPARCVAFAARHGFADILARFYPPGV